MTLSWPTKDPDEVLDYKIDWTDRLEDDETILSSTWIVPVGLTQNSSITQAKTTTVWLSGGATLGKIYKVLNRVVTSGGRTMDQTVELKVSPK
jgi:hypothetical protein